MHSVRCVFEHKLLTYCLEAIHFLSTSVNRAKNTYGVVQMRRKPEVKKDEQSNGTLSGEQITNYGLIGMSLEEVAKIAGMTPDAFEQKHGDVYGRGRALGRAKILSALYERAMSEDKDAVVAIKAYLYEASKDANGVAASHKPAEGKANGATKAKKEAPMTRTERTALMAQAAQEQFALLYAKPKKKGKGSEADTLQ